MANLSVCRRGMGVAAIEDTCIYAVGGLDDHTCHRTVERYDIARNSWSLVAAMNFERGGVAVVTYGIVIY